MVGHATQKKQRQTQSQMTKNKVNEISFDSPKSSDIVGQRSFLLYNKKSQQWANNT